MMLYFLVLALLRGAPGTDDWLQFRGPNGSGVSNTVGLPTNFGPEQNLTWEDSRSFRPVVSDRRRGSHLHDRE
jgi:hypothetical protein